MIEHITNANGDAEERHDDHDDDVRDFDARDEADEGNAHVHGKVRSVFLAAEKAAKSVSARVPPCADDNEDVALVIASDD